METWTAASNLGDEDVQLLNPVVVTCVLDLGSGSRTYRWCVVCCEFGSSGRPMDPQRGMSIYQDQPSNTIRFLVFVAYLVPTFELHTADVSRQDRST